MQDYVVVVTHYTVNIAKLAGSGTFNFNIWNSNISANATYAVTDSLDDFTGSITITDRLTLKLPVKRDVTTSVSGKAVKCVEASGVYVYTTVTSPVAVTVAEITGMTVTVTVGGEEVAANDDGTYSVAYGAEAVVKYTPAAGYVGTVQTKTVTVDSENGAMTVETTDITAPTAGVAKIGDVYYTTFSDAVDAVQDGETVTLVSDLTNAGITIDKQCAFTVDFGGYTYTVRNPGAGSEGTKTCVKMGTDPILQIKKSQNSID